MNVGDHLRELEESSLRPEVRRNPEALSSLLADEFREFGSSGVIYTKEQVIEALRTEGTSRFAISGFEARLLSESVALVTYRLTRWSEPGQAGAVSLRSSIWVMRDGRWQVVFHQGGRSL